MAGDEAAAGPSMEAPARTSASLPSSSRPSHVSVGPRAPDTTGDSGHASDGSLSGTKDYYGVAGRRTSTDRRSVNGARGNDGSAGTSSQSRSGGSYATRLNSSQPGVLPSSSFFHLRTSRVLDPSEPRRTGNGPLVTRVATDYSGRGEKLVTRRFSGQEEEDSPTSLSAAHLRTTRESQETFATPSLRTSYDAATDRQSADFHARSQSFDEPSVSSHGHGRDYSATTLAPLPSLDSQHRMTTQPSREPLLDFPTTAATPAFPTRPKHAHTPSGESRRTRVSIESIVQRARNSIARSRAGTEENAETVRGGKKSGVQILEGSGEYDRSTMPASRSSLMRQPRTEDPPSPPPRAPVTDDKGWRVRNYQLHEGSNRFFLAGRILSSKDNPAPFLASLFLALLLPVLFFVFSGPYLWTHLGGGGKASIFVFLWMSGIMLTNMCVTAWRDPGILPRHLDPVPERKWVADLGGEGVGGWRAEPKYVRIKEGVVASKWCETCETYRPPRTSHCRLCDNCVLHTDHHCSFLNNCIGRRSYTSFIAFLISSILCAIYVVAFSAWHIASRHAESVDPTSTSFGEIWASRWDVVGSFVVAVMSFGLMLPILGLFSYHARLLWSNRTTIEMLRPKADRSGGINPANGQATGNLYALNSPFANIVFILCRPMVVPSWISPHRYATRDPREMEEGKEGV